MISPLDRRSRSVCLCLRQANAKSRKRIAIDGVDREVCQNINSSDDEVQLGKLDLDKKVSELITHQQQVNNLEVLSIDPAHVYALENLPNEHRNPDSYNAIVETLGLDILRDKASSFE